MMLEMAVVGKEAVPGSGIIGKYPILTTSIPFSPARRVEAKISAGEGEECVGMFDRGWDAGSLPGDLNDHLCSLYSRDSG